MSQLKGNITELYKRTSHYESGVLIKNAIQNILDYRLLVGANSDECINQDIYKATSNILYNNCINSISMLNTLSSSYNLDLFYRESLNDKEKIDEFTLDFVMNICDLKCS